ncbi:MAG: hypothetical protein ACKN9E_13440 [Microcystaceae cyanobacterium]
MSNSTITVGSQVIYTPNGESGYVKSFNKKFIFVVFSTNATKDNFTNFTAAGCRWEDIQEA